MRAQLKPLRVSPHAQPFPVEMIARTGNRKIKVQGLNSGAAIFAADRFRLYDEADFRRRITEEEFARLPWQGAGPDPCARSEARAQAGGSVCSGAKTREPAPGRTDEDADTAQADARARIEEAMTRRGH